MTDEDDTNAATPPAEGGSAAFTRTIRELLRRPREPRPATPEPDPLIERLTRWGRKEADE